MVDIVCKHNKIPTIFRPETTDPVQNEAVEEGPLRKLPVSLHFRPMIALLELLIKYRWLRLLGESVASLLSWRLSTPLLGGLEADSGALVNADVLRYPEEVSLLALVCRSSKWWKCCKQIAVAGEVADQHSGEGMQLDNAGDVSEEVINLIRVIWKEVC